MAPFLAVVIVVAFAALRREWSILKRSFWWPGILLYFAIVLPWFIAVQHQNPTFFREFFLEHNLERFATNRYQHQQPFWYYLVVVLLAHHALDRDCACAPWWDGIQTSVAEWRLRHSRIASSSSRSHGDAFPEFLVLVGADSDRLLLLLAVEAARLHSALDSSHHHPDRRLSFRRRQRGLEPLGAGRACGAVRNHDHVRASAALVCGARRQYAADATPLLAALVAALRARLC